MNKYFFVLLVFVFSVTQVNAQKKKSLFEIVVDGIDSANKNQNKNTSGSTNSTSNKGVLSVGDSKFIKGEWKEFGAGGLGSERNFSPRNHIYTFEITQDIQKLTGKISSLGAVWAEITSSSGAIVERADKLTNPNFRSNPLKAGKYFLKVGQRQRGDTNPYEVELIGSVANIKKIEPQYLLLENNFFGEEGGGGKSISPRNHIYYFEPERDTWFDINVESTGVPIQIAIISPSGKQMKRELSRESPGIAYSIDKAIEKGKYTIIVNTLEPNQRGDYKLELVGNFLKSPEKVSLQEKKIVNKWTRQNIKHVYIFSVKEGNQEVMLRTTVGESNIFITDQFGSIVQGEQNLREPGLKNLIFKCTTAGNYKVEVETSNISGGEYELLFFGQFNGIEEQVQKNKLSQGQNSLNNNNLNNNTATGINPSGQLTNVTTYNNEELVLIKGNILDKKTKQVASNVRLIYEDLKTGEILGEIMPNFSTGEYEVSLPKGRRYGLTAIIDGYIASSENIDLTSKVISNKTIYKTKTIYVTPIEIGASINLNNIFFETGKPILLPESFTELNRLANLLNENSTIEVEIAGHTDNVGADTYNITLSKDRASSVINYLIAKGIESQRLQPKGYGKSRPVATNTTEEGKAQNRRVEFVILKK